MKPSNLYANVPHRLQDELFEKLVENDSFKLERIVSKGHHSKAGEWYDQDRDEWVILIKGSAGLRIEGQQEVIQLNPGDYILLPAHLRHRVEWTEANAETIWLALHY